jgi:cyclase
MPSSLFVLVIICLRTWGQGIDYAKIEILTEKIGPNLYMLSGSAGADPGHEDAAGGRIGILAGPDGIFMVDAQYAQITDKVLAAIRKISSEPIRFLVNTHVHPDHTAGNANFVKMGVAVCARGTARGNVATTGASG